MLIPLQVPEKWDLLNENLRKLLGYKIENPVKAYPNLYSAVEEISSQLASFLAHKRAFTWIKGMSPTFDAALGGFLRDGFQVQSVDWKVFSQFQGQETQWVDALPQNTLYVLGYEDHAVTGMKLNLDKFDEALNNKKIYFIRVSHFGLPAAEVEVRPYSVWIGPTGFNELAAAVCGARFRAPERGMPYHPWSAERLDERRQLQENRELIENVEKQFSDYKWFQNSDVRRYDRVALCFPDLTGDRVLRRLGQKMKIAMQGHLGQTTHLCDWDSVKIFKSWWTPTPSPEQLRGLVVFSVDVAKLPEFIPSLKEALEELKNEAEWQ